MATPTTKEAIEISEQLRKRMAQEVVGVQPIPFAREFFAKAFSDHQRVLRDAKDLASFPGGFFSKSPVPPAPESLGEWVDFEPIHAVAMDMATRDGSVTMKVEERDGELVWNIVKPELVRVGLTPNTHGTLPAVAIYNIWSDKPSRMCEWLRGEQNPDLDELYDRAFAVALPSDVPVAPQVWPGPLTLATRKCAACGDTVPVSKPVCPSSIECVDLKSIIATKKILKEM